MQIGDFIYEIIKDSEKTVRIGQIKEICCAGGITLVEHTRFTLYNVIGYEPIAPFIFLHKSDMNDYKFENNFIILFANESEFLKYLFEINESI